MHAYISSIAIETTLFTASTNSQQDDLMIRNMIKAALQLGKGRQSKIDTEMFQSRNEVIVYDVRSNQEMCTCSFKSASEFTL